MMNTPDNYSDNQPDYLDTDHDKTQDATNSDAAKFNTDEQEKAVNERQETEYSDAENADAGSAIKHTTTQPLTTQGDMSEVAEDFSGTTNLSLDQLKKEGDPEGVDGE